MMVQHRPYGLNNWKIMQFISLQNDYLEDTLYALVKTPSTQKLQ
jgi:hypothetical protein